MFKPNSIDLEKAPDSVRNYLKYLENANSELKTKFTELESQCRLINSTIVRLADKEISAKRCVNELWEVISKLPQDNLMVHNGELIEQFIENVLAGGVTKIGQSGASGAFSVVEVDYMKKCAERMKNG